MSQARYRVEVTTSEKIGRRRVPVTLIVADGFLNVHEAIRKADELRPEYPGALVATVGYTPGAPV